MNKNIISIFIILILLTISGKVSSNDIQPDVISYHLKIEPNIDEGIIKGSVVISFQVDKKMDSVIFNSGNLTIDKVIGSNVKSYKKINKNLVVYLSKRDCIQNEIVIYYSGYPIKGLIFDKEKNQPYTSYFTSDWMICHDSPEDKSVFHIDITVPTDITCIASGELVNKVQQNGKVLYSYQQNTETPSYTYGFAIGKYYKAEEKYGKVLLKYYSQNYSGDTLMAIFKETPTMISFFEEKSGIYYFQSTYSQVLTGKYYQEMSGFSMLKDIYGKMVLQDSTETNLI
jgi:aminopeptidase N